MCLFCEVWLGSRGKSVTSLSDGAGGGKERDLGGGDMCSLSQIENRSEDAFSHHHHHHHHHGCWRRMIEKHCPYFYVRAAEGSEIIRTGNGRALLHRPQTSRKKRLVLERCVLQVR